MTNEASLLIIDSRKRRREALRRRLEQHFDGATESARIHEVSSVQLGLEMLESADVDCILLSRHVGDFSLDALDDLAHRKTRVPVPVILVTDEEDNDLAAEAVAAGAHDVIDASRLGVTEPHRAVRNALDTVRMRRTLEKQRQELERGTAEPARYDAVTELPNRLLFRSHLSRALSRTTDATNTGVMLIGLDGFKAINSSFGHGVGDELLRMVAGRLRHCVRNVDTVARWGGDEFAALLEEMSRPEDAVFVAQRIMYALSSPFVYKGQDLYVTASVASQSIPPTARRGRHCSNTRTRPCMGSSTVVVMAIASIRRR